MTNFDNIPLVLTPFADNDAQKDFSFFESGITRQMTVPDANGGAKFTRHQMNGIGYLATLGAFLDRIGYPYGKERLDPTSFGGYPKGAILMTQENGHVREYISLIDNNIHPLPTEAEDGTYQGNEYWAPTIPTESASFFPDFSSQAWAAGGTIGPIGMSKTESRDFQIEDSGWYVIERIFSTSPYYSPTNNQSSVIQDSLRLLSYGFAVTVLGKEDSRTTISRVENLNGSLGAKASCMIPLAKSKTIRIEVQNGYTGYGNERSIYCHVNINRLKSNELQ